MELTGDAKLTEEPYRETISHRIKTTCCEVYQIFFHGSDSDVLLIIFPFKFFLTGLCFLDTEILPIRHGNHIVV